MKVNTLCIRKYYIFLNQSTHSKQISYPIFKYAYRTKILNMKKLFYLASALTMFISCNEKKDAVEDKDGLQFFSVDSLKQNITVLAGDDFTGRKPFTEGETKTINFLQDKFIQAGLEAGNGNSFFQEVPMVNIHSMAAPDMQVKSMLYGPTKLIQPFHGTMKKLYLQVMVWLHRNITGMIMQALM